MSALCVTLGPDEYAPSQQAGAFVMPREVSAMAATGLPRQIVLGPFTYRISAKAADWEQVGETLADSWGFTHHGSAVIMLNPTMPDALQRVALLHEILHACAFAGGQLKDRERSEEEWVAMVAPMLIDCIRRSPGLADFLVAP